MKQKHAAAASCPAFPPAKRRSETNICSPPRPFCRKARKQTQDKLPRAAAVCPAETTVAASLGVTQPRRPVSRDVINYTYADRNKLNYSSASKRQSQFPLFQSDE